MIQGLQLDVKGEELVGRIGTRVAHHEMTARAYGEQLERLRNLQPSLEEEHDVVGYRGRRAAEEASEMLERKMREHERRAATLSFLREHIARGEVYRLAEDDLRMADLVPDQSTPW